METVKIVALLTPAADVNNEDRDGKTPLLLATYFDNRPAVTALLDIPNIDWTAKTEFGCSVLRWARSNWILYF